MGDDYYGEELVDELKLVHYRALRNGVQHRHNISPLDPKSGERVTVRAVTPGKAAFEQAAIYFTTDGRTPSGSRGIAEVGETIPLERERVEWDSILWDYVIHWQAVIPGQAGGTRCPIGIEPGLGWPSLRCRWSGWAQVTPDRPRRVGRRKGTTRGRRARSRPTRGTAQT